MKTSLCFNRNQAHRQRRNLEDDNIMDIDTSNCDSHGSNSHMNHEPPGAPATKTRKLNGNVNYHDNIKPIIQASPEINLERKKSQDLGGS